MGICDCPGAKKIRVVVGEDSPLMRRIIEVALNDDPGIEVVGTASNGRDVLRKTVELKPDCITLDLEMPQMDGLETLRYLMSEWPTPVVVVSSHTDEGAEMTLKCLQYGAVDFVTKSKKGGFFPADELVSRVKVASTVDTAKIRFVSPECSLKSKPVVFKPTALECVVLIGASTGGPEALAEVLPKLPCDLQAGVIVLQHLPENFTRYLAERLDGLSKIMVKEAEEGDTILPGRALVACGGMHLFLEDHCGQPIVMLLPRNRLQRSSCPSVDFAMTSFAPVFRERLIGVILTGMGRDGAAGGVAVHRFGGRMICQDEETSLVFGMPGAVIRNGLADKILPLEEIGNCIVGMVREVAAREPVI